MNETKHYVHETCLEDAPCFECMREIPNDMWFSVQNPFISLEQGKYKNINGLYYSYIGEFTTLKEATKALGGIERPTKPNKVAKEVRLTRNSVQWQPEPYRWEPPNREFHPDTAYHFDIPELPIT